MGSRNPMGGTPQPVANSYLLAALGTGLGTLIALPTGFIVAVLLFTLLGSGRFGGNNVVIVIVGFAWLGAILGCWLMLRSVGRRRSGRTAAVLAFAFPLAWLLSSRLHGERFWPALLVLLALVILLALPARFVAVKWLGSQNDAWLSEQQV